MKEPAWKTAKEYTDITYKKCNGVARIAFNRPEVRNAFRPKTTSECWRVHDAQEDLPWRGLAFCRRTLAQGMAFSVSVVEATKELRGIRVMLGGMVTIGWIFLEVQRLIRFMPKAVIAVVPGWLWGGAFARGLRFNLQARTRHLQTDRCRCYQFWWRLRQCLSGQAGWAKESARNFLS